jgi:two-component sensor histidine kinase
LTSPPAPILYIDDDEGIRRLVSRSLARQGFAVVTAASGAEGVAMARAQDFVLIAVDHYMPGQDGLATLAMLRELPGCPPVVYVTGSEESRVAVAALKAGADDYVVKSVSEDFLDLLGNTFKQVLERAELRRARARVEAELRASNARLEAMLKEINHRVANNLQMVISFIALQSKSLVEPSAKEALQKTEQRIRTIAQVSQRLYTTGNVEFVAMDEYLAGLAADLSESWSTPVAVRTVTSSAAALKLCTDKAVTLGMIANEWVSNACKYAYGETENGNIRISLESFGPDHFQLAVEDDGVGLPADGSVRGTGLGSRLVDAMARAHDASVQYSPVDRANRGTRAAIILPLGERDRPLSEFSIRAVFDHSGSYPQELK